MNAPAQLRAIGLDPETLAPAADEAKLLRYIALKLAAMGHTAPVAGDDPAFREIAAALLSNHLEKNRLLSDYLCPVDRRIQDWLEHYLAGVPEARGLRLPNQTFILDRHGLARLLSLPPGCDRHATPILSSYRLRNGVLHNPRADRRTTAGVFHIAEGGLPAPADKLLVPREAFAGLLARALRPPPELARLPFTAESKAPAEVFVSLLLRPVVVPGVPGVTPEKSLEVRFFAPGSLVANLDFVESIFGNAGDPYLPENDAGLDPAHWTGHTGCVLLAPHLVGVSKRELGLPHWDRATERQRRDGMAWREADEPYNGGQPFKACARDERGVILTVIADNYFGYCKKEVKTQVSFSANLFGLAEEEHAGGTLAFPSYDLGEEFAWDLVIPHPQRTMEDAAVVLGHEARYFPEGHAIDRQHPHIVYVPADARFDLESQSVRWKHDGAERCLRLCPDQVYVYPWGYTVRMHQPGGRAWRLVGTVAEGRLCHKPSTVSGGGKSEISKPITDGLITGPVYISDFQRDFEAVEELLRHDYGNRFRPEFMKQSPSRPILSRERSLGSVIKLFTPSALEYTDAYNQWLRSIPQHIKELVFVLKRFYKPEWGESWRERFSVDIINGVPGNELKLGRRKLATAYLRVGYGADGSWRVFSLRKDFHPCAKIQTEDDITASITLPVARLHNLGPGAAEAASAKLVHNCEYRLFQRPDDAVHRGQDRGAEADIAGPGNFLSNYEPLGRKEAWDLVNDTIGFEQFTEPVRRLIRAAAAEEGPAYFCSPHQPRIVDGKASKNPRYLQTRPDLLAPGEVRLRQASMRLSRRIPHGQPLLTPVSILLPGRRSNAPDRAAGVPALCCFGPIHYLELPEFFADAIASMTGKSPSTTGAGSEGALTKGPFNALCPVTDLNNALVSMILTGAHSFVTTAGTVGPRYRVDHDVSLLVPEIFARMQPEERDPAWLAANHYLERVADGTYGGRSVPAGLLGWRVTPRFTNAFGGRIFTSPELVFPEEMLRPELQDEGLFAESVETIVATMRRVAALYFEDGSVEDACPPLRALLHIMKDGDYEGFTLRDEAVRRMFSRDYLLASDWYSDRLTRKQILDEQQWTRHVEYLQAFLARPSHREEAERLNISGRLEEARAQLRLARSHSYLEALRGTIGLDPLHRG